MVDPDNAGFPGITIAQLRELLDTGTYLNTDKGGWLDHDNGTWWGDDVQWVENKPTTLQPYLESHPADIILLHIGTNSIPSNALHTEIQNVENILMKIDEYESNHNKKVMVIVAGIINRACSLSSQYSACQQSRLSTTTFNELVKDKVATRIAAGEIIWVDMETEAQIVYNRPDMIDVWHPDESGYQKMAAVWKNALVNNNLLPNCNLVPDSIPPSPPTNLMIIN